MLVRRFILVLGAVPDQSKYPIIYDVSVSTTARTFVFAVCSTSASSQAPAGGSTCSSSSSSSSSLLVLARQGSQQASHLHHSMAMASSGPWAWSRRSFRAELAGTESACDLCSALRHQQHKEQEQAGSEWDHRPDSRGTGGPSVPASDLRVLVSKENGTVGCCPEPGKLTSR